MSASTGAGAGAGAPGSVILFGVRHLSPAGAFHLRHLLDRVRPRLVLVEGPCDMDPLLPDLVRGDTVPPVALLACTDKAPMDSVLYPLAEYSPEYQAALWADRHNVPCRFMDLPTDVLMGLRRAGPEREAKEASEAKDGSGTGTPEDGRGGSAPSAPDTAPSGGAARPDASVPADPDAADGYETFWERVLEHAADEEAYREGARAFGAGLRELGEREGGEAGDGEENALREAHMRRIICRAIEEGIPAEQIVAVTGAWHVSALRGGRALTDRELAALPRTPTTCTLMPYSNFRLSSRTGYGAGNKAPAYYGLLWRSLTQGDPSFHVHAYLSGIAAFLRGEEQTVAVADVIEAVRLAFALAHLRGSPLPALPDLRDAAITCLGRGSPARVAKAMAGVEVGDTVGSLPEGVSRTALQEDFHRRLKELRLERFMSQVTRELQLDLREKRTVKSEKSAYLDLSRSFFLHRLRVLGIPFARRLEAEQEKASWAESWEFSWTPEAEISLVECSLTGDTLTEAVSARFRERLAREDATAAELAEVMEDAFLCGLSEEMAGATKALQAATADVTGLTDLALTLERLSLMLRYGDVRRMDPAPLTPLLSQVYLRCCLLVPDACTCDETGAPRVAAALEKVNAVELAHEGLETAFWLRPLEIVALRDTGNPGLSGLATAILLERGAFDPALLSTLVSRRLSPGTPAEAGAGWFAGLAGKNRHALLARLSLWQALDTYVAGLDEEDFRRALVFLRRAFADFTSADRDRVGENLGELWGLAPERVSEAVNTPLDRDAQKLADDLEGFDFSDF